MLLAFVPSCAISALSTSVSPWDGEEKKQDWCRTPFKSCFFFFDSSSSLKFGRPGLIILLVESKMNWNWNWPGLSWNWFISRSRDLARTRFASSGDHSRRRTRLIGRRKLATGSPRKSRVHFGMCAWCCEFLIGARACVGARARVHRWACVSLCTYTCI